MITIESIDTLSNLACLSLTSQEKEEIVKDLGQVFHWVSQFDTLCLQAIEPSPFEPMVMREDRIDLQGAHGDKILANAPEVEEGFFVVPSILEE